MSDFSDFRQREIFLWPLSHTNKKDGDDAGYRNVRVQESGDPLVRINDVVRCLPIYAIGAYPGLCPYYGKGLGASPDVLIRAPAAYALVAANGLLFAYGREVLVVDAWRSAKVQSLLWQDLRKRVLTSEGRTDDELSITDEVRIGLLADDIGSYAPVVKDERYAALASTLEGDSNVSLAARFLGKTEAEVIDLYLTFRGNLGLVDLTLDETGTTAHGNGGATDVYLWNTKANKPTCLGVPFDFVGPESMMDFFEDLTNLSAYQAKIEQDAGLRQYLTECGIGLVGMEVFMMIRDERRLLFHTMMTVGATFYLGEPWHFNHSNQLGGLSADKYPQAGSGCQSLLKNVRDEHGEYVAVWGNEAAHRMACELLGS